MAMALGALDDPARFLRKSGQTRSGAIANAGLVADVLPVLSPTQILDACFDTRPAGLVRVLGKVGFGILDEDTYAFWGPGTLRRKAPRLIGPLSRP